MIVMAITHGGHDESFMPAKEKTLIGGSETGGSGR